MGHVVIESPSQFPDGASVTAYGGVENYERGGHGAPLPQFTELGTATVKEGKVVIEDPDIIPGIGLWCHSEVATDDHRWVRANGLASESVTLTGPATTILAPSLTRSYVTVINTGDTNQVSLAIGGKDAVAGEGIVLQPNGGSWTLVGVEEGAGTEVSAAGSGTVTVTAW